MKSSSEHLAGVCNRITNRDRNHISMRILLLCLPVILLLSGCFKKSGCKSGDVTTVAPPAEQTAVQDYLLANSIVATRHKSGLYYQIINAGDGASVQQCSVINISYVGTFTNGAMFESNPNLYIELYSLIDGFRIGIPLIKGNGRIKLFVPSSLGYGASGRKDNTGNVIIPPNSILIYDVVLVGVD